MIVAELRRRLPDTGEVETIARIVAPDDGPAMIQADPERVAAVEELLAIGAPGGGGRTYYLEDGAEFVRRLPSAFRGQRLWAELIDDEA